jgi:hypothetical protein
MCGCARKRPISQDVVEKPLNKVVIISAIQPTAAAEVPRWLPGVLSARGNF